MKLLKSTNKLPLLFILLGITSCKSPHEVCDAYSGIIILKDSTTIVTEHINFGKECHPPFQIKKQILDTIYLTSIRNNEK